MQPSNFLPKKRLFKNSSEIIDPYTISQLSEKRLRNERDNELSQNAIDIELLNDSILLSSSLQFVDQVQNVTKSCDKHVFDKHRNSVSVLKHDQPNEDEEEITSKASPNSKQKKNMRDIERKITDMNWKKHQQKMIKHIDINSLEERRKNEIKKIQSVDVDINESEEEESYGFIFDFMMEKTQNEYLHLPINTLIQLGNLVRSRIVQTPKRGPHRTLTPHDQLLVYLEWISSSDTLKKIASSLKITETMACQAITEVRPILLDVLERRFSSPPRPPLPAPGPFSNVALLVDATTVKVATPVIDYEDKKKLFDGHHYCYCMKFEVAVSSWFPHKALFVSDAVEGGVHDIELYQNGVERYVKYLKKTPEELLRSSEQDEKGSWSIMGDRGYQGQFPDIDL